MMQMSDMMNMMAPGTGLLMALFWLVLVGLAVFGAVMTFRALIASKNGSARASSHDDALTVARERLARGQIDRQEFNEIKEALAEP